MLASDLHAALMSSREEVEVSAGPKSVARVAAMSGGKGTFSGLDFSSKRLTAPRSASNPSSGVMPPSAAAAGSSAASAAAATRPSEGLSSSELTSCPRQRPDPDGPGAPAARLLDPARPPAATLGRLPAALRCSSPASLSLPPGGPGGGEGGGEPSGQSLVREQMPSKTSQYLKRRCTHEPQPVRAGGWRSALRLPGSARSSEMGADSCSS